MFMNLIYIFIIFFGLNLHLFSQNVTPSPTPTPPPQVQSAMTFAESLQDFTNQSIVARQLFINQVEKPLSGYFYTLAQLLALIMFSWAIAQMITTQGGISAGDIWRIGIRCAIGFLLLFFAGDVDGDGVRGDLINYPASVGYYYAYGVSKNGQVEGSFLNKEVIKNENAFNEQYKKFTENKLMVRVSSRDMPVHYPTMEDMNLLSALYTGKPLSQQELDEAKSRSWQMSMLFGSLNFSRGVLAFADFFLFFISGFAVLVLRLALPLMIGAMFHKEYGQKMTTGFFWSAFVWTIVFPGMCQFIRLLAYSAGNVALGMGGQNPYYSFDATSGAIVSNGNPETIVLIASLYMLFSGLCLFAAFFLSMYLCQGKILEGIVSTTSAWWTAATSVGTSLAFGAISSRMNMEADHTQNQANRDSALSDASFQKQIAENSAKNTSDISKMRADTTANSQLIEASANKKAEDMMTNANYQNASIGAYSGLVEKIGNVQVETYQAKANALMNLRANWDNLTSKERQEKASNFLDEYSKNGDALMKEQIQAIKDKPEALDLLSKEIDQYIKGVPVAGSVLNTLGINGDAFNVWLRSDAGKVALGSMLTKGNPAGSAMLLNQYVNTEDGFGGIISDKTISNAQNQANLARQQLEIAQQNNQFDSGPGIQPSYSSPKSMTHLQKNNLNRLKKFIASEPDFIPTLQKMCARNGWNPDDMLNFMALETANTFNKSIRGGGTYNGTPHNYVGLIQFGEEARKDLNRIYGTPIDVVGFQNHLRSITAGQQLKYVESYLKQRERGGIKLDSVSKMYAAVGAGSVANNDNAVIFRKGGYRMGDFANTRKISGAGYSENSIWDFNKDGIIQQYEFGSAAKSRLGAGQFFSYNSKQFNNANQALKEIAQANPAKAKVIASQRARTIERDFQIEQNSKIRQGKDAIATQHYGEQRQIEVNKFNDSNTIADNVAAQKAQFAQTSYNFSMQGAQIMRDSSYSASNTRFQGKVQAVNLVKQNEYSIAHKNYENDMRNALLGYQSRDISSQIQYEASAKSSHLRAMAQMFNNIGSSVGHHISEASEKFARV